jgi:hypothetical protein
VYSEGTSIAARCTAARASNRQGESLECRARCTRTLLCRYAAARMLRISAPARFRTSLFWSASCGIAAALRASATRDLTKWMTGWSSHALSPSLSKISLRALHAFSDLSTASCSGGQICPFRSWQLPGCLAVVC